MDIVKILIDAGRAAIGVPAAAYALSSIGLNLQFGYTGLLNFGHVASMLVGAYGMAITVDMGGSLWLGIPVGTNQHGSDVTEVEQTGVSELQIEADR